MSAKITAPVEGYTGVSAGVSFADGVGHTDEPHLVEWFRAKGYKVEEEDDGEAAAKPKAKAKPKAAE